MTVAGTDDIDLSANEFWALPLAERAAAFARLRSEPRPRFFAEPEVPFSDQGPGYYALVRYADVVEASKHHGVFCSGKGATNIPDLPAEFNEYFGSMINMDDPRHARLRRIVSRAFSPAADREVRGGRAPCGRLGRRRPAGDRAVRLRADRRGAAAAEDHLRHDGHPRRPVRHGPGATPTSSCPGPTRSSCPRTWTRRCSSSSAPAQALADLVTALAAERAQAPRDDLVSALVTANIDGEQLTSAELASFFILLVVAGNETTRNALSHALMLLTEFPDQRALLLADMDDRLERRGRGDRPVRLAGHVHAADPHPGLHHERAGLPQGRQGGAVLLLGQPRRGPSSPTPSASTSPARPTRTSGSARPGRTSASAPTWPAARSG